MADSSEASSEKMIWDSFLGNLKTVMDQVQDGEGRQKPAENFDIHAYWKKMDEVFRALSHEATKMSMAYCRPPPPSNEACESLLASVEKTVLVLVSVFSNLPKSSGLTLRKTSKDAVKQIVGSIINLAETIKSTTAGSPEQFQNTGIVWEGADQFKSLPRDNRDAVCLVISRVMPLISDAHDELNEALNNDDDDDDGLADILGDSHVTLENDERWSDSDKTMLQSCLGLLKCSKSIAKKTKSAVAANGCCENEEKITQMDDLVDHIDRLSPAVDELGACVYPPIVCAVVKDKAADLALVNKSLLEFLRQSHMTGEDDQKWITFLLRANTHNMTKIDSFVSGGS